MRTIPSQELLHLPVYTKMGMHIGSILDVELDEAEFRVEHFLVQPKGMAGMFKKPLLIHRTAVVELTKDRLIVEDALRGNEAAAGGDTVA